MAARALDGSGGNVSFTANPILADDGGARKPVRVVHLPLDVDSYSTSVADLTRAIEAAWLEKLRSVFGHVYSEDFRGMLGEAWEEEFNAQFAAQSEALVAACPYKVSRIVWPVRGRAEMVQVTDRDLEKLDDIEMVTVELPPLANEGAVRGKVAVVVSGTEFSLDCEVERKRVNMFLAPSRFRVSTRKRIATNNDDTNLAGGVSCVKVCNWDVAVCWLKLEKDPKCAEIYSSLKARVAGQKKAGSADVAQSADEGETDAKSVIVELFSELTGAGVAEIGSDDICDFMDKSRLSEARERCEKWSRKSEWSLAINMDLGVIPAEHATTTLALLEDFEKALKTLDKANNFLASYSTKAETMMRDTEIKVETTMQELLALRPCCISLGDPSHLDHPPPPRTIATAARARSVWCDSNLNSPPSSGADDISCFLDEKRLQSIAEAASEQSQALGKIAEMLDLALVKFERNKYLRQLKRAGLLCVTRNCQIAGESDGGVPRMVTLITAPNDRLEFEADRTKLKKRVQSQNPNIRGPHVQFFTEKPDEGSFYPYQPYFEPPVLGTGTTGCIFSHAEREDLIWSIIEGSGDLGSSLRPRALISPALPGFPSRIEY
jgi:hypothetical protein